MTENVNAEAIKDVGIFGLKTLVALNSGASLVLLTIIGNIFNNDRPSDFIDLDSMKCAMSLFLTGIIFAMASVAFTYCLGQLSAIKHASIEDMNPVNFILWMIVPAIFYSHFSSLVLYSRFRHLVPRLEWN